MDGKFLQLFKVPETRRKILATLGFLALFRLGFQIPIPGMNPEYLDTLSDRARGNQLFGLMNAFSGGQIGSTVIFALGIMPYISASIIFSMLSKVSPRIEAVAKEGAAGQKKINQWTRLVTVPIALIQAIFIYTGVFVQDPELIAPGVDPGIGLFAVVVVSLLAGAVLVMWIGELITEYGIGNGASVIIMARIIASMPSNVTQLIGSGDFYHTLLYLCAIWLVTVVVIVYITKGARRVPIQYARLTRGRRVYGGQKHYLPLKINMAGVMPIIFASILFVIPGVLANLLSWDLLAEVFNSPTGFVYVASYVLLIFSFCFFWNRLMFNAEEIADNLREHGSVRPGDSAWCPHGGVPVGCARPHHSGRCRVPCDHRGSAELRHGQHSAAASHGVLPRGYVGADRRRRRDGPGRSPERSVGDAQLRRLHEGRIARTGRRWRMGYASGQ